MWYRSAFNPAGVMLYLLAAGLIPLPVWAQTSTPAPCAVVTRFFEEEVWAKVGERNCWRCHRSGGDAAESDFRLTEVPWLNKPAAETALEINRQAFSAMARATVRLEDGSSGDKWLSRLLLKASGQLDHGGGAVLKPDSVQFQILSRFARCLRGETGRLEEYEPGDYAPGDFFAGVELLTSAQLLRRTTLSLCGRLPRADELQRVQREGLAAMDLLLDELLNEPAFYSRLKEAYNDIFLTQGIEDNAETLLSYDHFELTRQWIDQHDFSHLPEDQRQPARWKMYDVYRDSLLREPMELVEHIVRGNRPFTQLITADYLMVSPYTARGYGIFESLRSQFQNPEDPFEYVPAKLPALKSRDGKVQESPTALYPHAGLLTTFHYLRRYPTTETNRNRLRARMLYQHFLGIDIMQLAPRNTDASAVTAEFQIPTMEATDCVVCHRTIDPVAGIFQDFDPQGYLSPRKQGWYTDMFPAGFEGQVLPASEKWRAQQWLAERVTNDPRFAVAIVEHAYYILMGRKPLAAPDDIDDPNFNARRRAYRTLRGQIEQIAQHLRDNNYNFKIAIKDWILSPFYQVNGLSMASGPTERWAEIDDLGIARILSPEQLERKIAAVFGKRWGKLEGDFKTLYGGIDSLTVTERLADPSGAMGAMQRIMANDVACYHVAEDFRRSIDQRLLFPDIEPSVQPIDDQSVDKIRGTIVYLHQRILGREDSNDSVRVTGTFQLFKSIYEQAREQQNISTRESYFCGGREAYQTPDPDYTIRAWRAVVTFLLLQPEFLFE